MATEDVTVSVDPTVSVDATVSVDPTVSGYKKDATVNSHKG